MPWACPCTAYSRSLVGVDGVSVLTHTTVNDDQRHDYRFCCVLCDVFMSFRLETNILLLSPTGHQTWVSCRGHYTFFFFFLLVFFIFLKQNNITFL